MLTFDPVRHEYFWCGKKVPGVTSVLQPLQDFSMVAPDVLAAAQARGTAVHKMTELHDAGDLDEDFLEVGMLPYLAAYKNFRADTGFTPMTRETKLYHRLLHYSGTSDMTGLIKHRRAVIDIKSMFTPGSPVIGVQTAAYKELHNQHGEQIEDRYALHLRNDGTYRLHPYTDPSDWPAFVSLLTIMNWRNKHGI